MPSVSSLKSGTNYDPKLPSGFLRSEASSFRTCFERQGNDYREIPCAKMYAAMRPTTTTASPPSEDYLPWSWHPRWWGYQTQLAGNPLRVDPTHPHAVPTGFAQNPSEAANSATWQQVLQSWWPYLLAVPPTLYAGYCLYQQWSQRTANNEQRTATPAAAGGPPLVTPEQQNLLPATFLPRRNSV